MKMSQWRRAVEDRCVFSARLKALADRSGDHNAGGNYTTDLFQKHKTLSPLLADYYSEAR